MNTITQTPTASQTTPIAAALREVAFVLQVTRRVKASILADQPEPKPALKPATRFEHAVGV